MPRRTKIMLGLAVAAAVVAGVVVAVQLSDDDSDEKRPNGDQQAKIEFLEVLPETTTGVTFVDRDAAAARLDLDKFTHDASEDEVERYLKSLADEASVTPLAPYLTTAESPVLNDFDVDWHLAATDSANNSWGIYRIDDRVDLDAMGKGLVAEGYSEQTVGGHSRYIVDLASSQNSYPPTFLDLTVLEEQRLIVTGTDPAPVVEVVDGRQKSVAENAAAQDLFARADPAEYVIASIGSDIACRSLVPGSGPEPSSGEAGVSDLGRPEATGTFLVRDGTDTQAVAVLHFASDSEAAADAGAREDWLRDGVDPVQGAPNADLLTVSSVQADGQSVTVKATYARGSRMAVEMAMQGSGATACGG